MEHIRIQDDLYTYVNQETLDKLVIPDDKPTAGGFAKLAEGVEKIMMEEFSAMTQSGTYPDDHLKRACALYAIAMDVDRKEQHGITPALKNLAILDQLNTVEDFSRLYKTLSLRGIPTPINIGVETDMKNTSRHLTYIQGAGVILPDASYYKPEMAAQKEQLLGIWANVAGMVMAKTDLTPEEQSAFVRDAMAFDEIIGGLAKTSEEWSRYVEMYNPMDTAEVTAMLSTLDFDAILKDLFGHLPATVVVTEPRYFEGFAGILNPDTLPLYKHWAYVTGLLRSCSLLSEELREMGGMYHRAIMGVAKMQDVDKFAYNLASDTYAEPVGMYYGNKYFG
ncbi:MAG: M13 family peptidase, partial [Ruminococcaceae bacterium]|nr:M13 family peptidase [Oscillospiraceae bacterium]